MNRILLFIYLFCFKLFALAQHTQNLRDIETTGKILVLSDMRIICDSSLFKNYFAHNVLEITKLPTKGFDNHFIFYKLKLREMNVTIDLNDSFIIIRNYFKNLIGKKDSFIICSEGGFKIYQLHGFQENEIKELTSKIRSYYEKYYYSYKRIRFKKFISEFQISGFDIERFKRYW